MKLKWYLRGLGIGIVVTALIMGISLGGKKEMSDAEIIERAKELGMTEVSDENTGLYAELEEESSKEDASEEVLTSEVSSETEEVTVSEETTVPEETTTPEEMTAPEETTVPEETTTQEESTVQDVPEPESSNNTIVAGEIVSITIVSGDDSAVVSKKLEAVGLVVSAQSYDEFLCNNGYARRLATGTYEIAIGSSEETIAKIITKSN